MFLPDGVLTVMDLIAHMGRQMKLNFIDPDSGRLELEQDLEIILNGKEIWFYPGALNTPMKDGDKVEIYMLSMGGG